MNKIIFFLLLIYAFSLPVSRSAITVFSILVPLLWFINGAMHRDFKLLDKKGTLYCLLLIPVFHAISLLWSDNLLFGLQNIKMFLYWLMIPAIISVIDKEKARSLISAFIYGNTFSCFISYLIMFRIVQYNGVTPANPSPFMNDIEYSVFLALCLLLMIQRIITYIKTRNVMNIIITSAHFLFIIFVLLSIYGRTGQVAFLLVLPIVIIVNYRFNYKTIIISPLIILLLCFAGYLTDTSFKHNNRSAFTDLNNTIAGRYDGSGIGLRIGAWLTAFEAIKEKPLLGSGVGDYMDDYRKKIPALPQYRASDWLPHLHNQYVQTAMQTGIIGIMICFLYMLKYFTIRVPDAETKSLQITFASVYLISCIMEPLWAKQFSTSLFALFTGIILGLSESPPESSQYSNDLPTP